MLFNDRLRATRMNRGYTLQQTADFLGIPLHSYQNYEAGSRQPDYALLVAIADCLDVPLDFLFGRDDYLRKIGVQIDVSLDVPLRRGH